MPQMVYPHCTAEVGYLSARKLSVNVYLKHEEKKKEKKKKKVSDGKRQKTCLEGGPTSRLPFNFHC